MHANLNWLDYLKESFDQRYPNQKYKITKDCFKENKLGWIEGYTLNQRSNPIEDTYLPHVLNFSDSSNVWGLLSEIDDETLEELDNFFLNKNKEQTEENAHGDLVVSESTYDSKIERIIVQVRLPNEEETIFADTYIFPSSDTFYREAFNSRFYMLPSYANHNEFSTALSFGGTLHQRSLQFFFESFNDLPDNEEALKFLDEHLTEEEIIIDDLDVTRHYGNDMIEKAFEADSTDKFPNDSTDEFLNGMEQIHIYEKVKNSIKEKGLLNPISVIDKTIIDGLHRTIAWKNLGNKTIRALKSSTSNENGLETPMKDLIKSLKILDFQKTFDLHGYIFELDRGNDDETMWVEEQADIDNCQNSKELYKLVDKQMDKFRNSSEVKEYFSNINSYTVYCNVRTGFMFKWPKCTSTNLPLLISLGPNADLFESSFDLDTIDPEFYEEFDKIDKAEPHEILQIILNEDIILGDYVQDYKEIFRCYSNKTEDDWINYIEKTNVYIPSIEIQKKYLKYRNESNRSIAKLEGLKEDLKSNPVSTVNTLEGLEAYNKFDEKRGKKEREILGMCKKGETINVEFKSALSINKGTKAKDKSTLFNNLIKPIASFLNTKGGVILYGVNDQGEITGIDGELLKHYQNNKDLYLRQVMDALKNQIPRRCHEYSTNLQITEFIEIKDKTILKIEVNSIPSDRYQEHNCWVQEKNKPKILPIRNTATTQSLTADKASDYITQHSKEGSAKL